MSRADLLGLSDQALADLTNKGTLRRARKEIDEAKVTWQLTEDDSGLVKVEFDDGVECELPADRPFADWTCTCLAGSECRHLVRSVLAYQQEFGASPDSGAGSVSEADGAQGMGRESGEPGAVSPVQRLEADTEFLEVDDAASGTKTGVSAHGATGRLAGDLGTAQDEDPGAAKDATCAPSAAGAFDPASITGDQLAASLSATQLRQAAKLIATGPLGHVGSTGGLAVVRLYHPTAVTVRFLAGSNLNYVRCSCRDPDPCLHVAVAVAVAGGKPFGESGLRVLEGPAWQPEPGVLDEVATRVIELLRVGLEASHRSLAGPWQRLIARARQADLHHLANLSEEIVTETARYAKVDSRFEPERLVSLAGELLARANSLRGTYPERIPDRLVAGSLAKPSEVGRAKLIGLGTELVEADEQVQVIANLVDARTGTPMRVVKSLEDTDHRVSRLLAGGLIGGAPLNHWGGGQVLVPAGKIQNGGDFSPGNRRVTAMPSAGLDQLEPPFRVSSIDELAHHQSRLPAILDDRTAGTNLAVCQFASVSAVLVDTTTRQLQATLVDQTGDQARLVAQLTARTVAALEATAEVLQQWSERPPDQLLISGRWHWTSQGPVVTPFLLAGDDLAIQPMIAAGTGGEQLRVLSVPSDEVELSSAGAIIATLDQALGQTLIAGLDRIAADPELWGRLAARLRRAGSVRFADLAGQVSDNTPEAAASLLEGLAFARTLV